MHRPFTFNIEVLVWCIVIKNSWFLESNVNFLPYHCESVYIIFSLLSKVCQVIYSDNKPAYLHVIILVNPVPSTKCFLELTVSDTKGLGSYHSKLDMFSDRFRGAMGTLPLPPSLPHNLKEYKRLHVLIYKCTKAHYFLH